MIQYTLTSSILSSAIMVVMLAGCQSNKPYEPSDGHIGIPPKVEAKSMIPEVVERVPYLPPPSPVQKPEPKYTVVVNSAPVKDVLFALARDAKLNLDVLNDIEGEITINAIDQTLPQIMGRIGKRVGIRYRIENDVLEIAKDTPYLRTYKIPYLNISRSSVGAVSMSVRVGATGTGISGADSSVSNDSTARIQNTTNNQFWEELLANLAQFVAPASDVNTDQTTAPSMVQPSAAQTENSVVPDAPANSEQRRSDVIINRSAGLVTVRATEQQHKQVRAYIEQVVTSAQRQILIEATIVEVKLSNQYSQGIDWRRVVNSGNGLSFDQRLTSGALNASQQRLSVSYLEQNGNNTLNSTIRLLEKFGNVKVLSSPKIMALNNQPSILKVVDNRVYFSLDFETTAATANTQASTNVRSTINTVPVGFVMSLVPYVDESDEVVLNVRPTISRIIGFVNDPNPLLASNNVVNPVPEVQVREMETVLKLNSGQVAILGGLMQDTASKQTQRVPGVGGVPAIGELFTGKDSSFEKSELVIFVRPIHVRNPTLEGDLKSYQRYLPSARIMSEPKATNTGDKSNTRDSDNAE